MSDSKPKLEEFGLDASIYAGCRAAQRIEDKNNKIVSSAEKSFLSDLIVASTLCLFIWLFIWLFFWLGATFSEALSSFTGWIWLANVALFVALFSFLSHFYDKKEVSAEGFFYNLISRGRYKRALHEVQKARKEIKFARHKVRLFEKAFTNYYKGKIDNFYNTNLYRKKSGTNGFEELLSEFNSILDSFSNARSLLLNWDIDDWGYVEKYKDYIEKRTGDHKLQIIKTKNIDVNSLKDFSRQITRAKKRNNLEPPEKLYRTSRKINWENINKERMETGLKGEKIVIEMEKDYLKSINKDDLADKVQHVSLECGDGLGYDVLSFFTDGREKYIEVKSTTKSLRSKYYLTINELKFLKEHPENSFIYRIFVSNNNEKHLVVYSGKEFLEKNKIIPIQYSVTMK